MINVPAAALVGSDARNDWPGFPPSRDTAMRRELQAIEKQTFGTHPFTFGITHSNIRTVLEQYAVMSTEFPFAQARALANAYFNRNDDNVPPQVQLTSVVGAFLIFDEFGAHAKVREGGNAALPSILDPKAFHSSLLLDDCTAILGEPVSLSATTVTRAYLDELACDLGATDDITRTAAMVAFEQHAGTMIESLWGSVAPLYKGDRSNLLYFETHVGGDDPAEAYHQEMTARLIAQNVPVGAEKAFLDAFRKCYRLNHDWCEAIKA